MRYGFVLDQRKCIGCHACTVACKAENQVPVGSFRTWVKYVEKGTYPAARRHFAVLRCNHCDNAPCVRICPVRALYTRPDGIVDLDGDKCIGCQSCLQACPYDALYIHPDLGTAQKCHYCAHRVERGLEPACVIVCPVQAIVPGDLDNPQAEIAQLVATIPVQARKPEQGTQPKVFYLGADQDAISPGGHSEIPASYLWAEGPAEILQQLTDPAQAPATREVYNVSHARPWGWQIAAYLWTKSIAAGLAMLAAFQAVQPDATAQPQRAPILSAIFLALTLGLLVADLRRPERFWRLLLAPNWTSWLVWGGYILMAFGAAVAWWWWVAMPHPLLLLALAVAAAGYSAFLFAQAEGRDFWQSALLLPHLLAQAVVAGAAVWMLAGEVDFAVENWLALGLVFHALMICGEIALPHSNRDTAQAARFLTHRRAAWFWGGAMALGILLPLFSLTLVGEPLQGLAAAVALAGLYIYEHLWIEAGQAPPLS